MLSIKPGLREVSQSPAIESSFSSLLTKPGKPDTKKALPLALLRCVKQEFFSAVIPRLFLILFRYSQPPLIKESIRYVIAQQTGEESVHGYWLIVSAMGIYVGVAVRLYSSLCFAKTYFGLQLSTAVYQHRINRLKLVTRSALVGIIHTKTMNSPSIAHDNGEATTLMSTDADSLDGIAEMVHETWAQIIEVLIGIRLLSLQVGWIWPLPLFLIYRRYFPSQFSGY